MTVILRKCFQTLGVRSLPVLHPVKFGAAALFSSTRAPTCRVVALGDRVLLRMDGKLSGGDALHKTDGENNAQLKFIVGARHVLPGVEDAVQGMTKGESKTVEIEPAMAFGAEKQILSVPLKEMNLPEKERELLAVGQVLELAGGERAHVVKVMDDIMDIDLAHPYAGQSLTVTLEVLEHELHSELQAHERLVLPQVIEQGDGVTFPQRGDTMIMHYTGKLAESGSVFDSSRDRGQPFQFQIGVGQVIRGWDEGVMRMSKGMKATLNIPSVKGYGKNGAGGVIPPHADLIFDVELLDIVRK
uniref:peptidylprolyl isomerase n=1 Tax=Peronospora matthiolae TaxID=2874970 RepID=A0AAV1UQD0_9STRA